MKKLFISVFIFAVFFAFGQGGTRATWLKQFEFAIPDDGTAAIATDGEFFYMPRTTTGLWTKHTLTGEQVDMFLISGLTLRALAYDGHYFWGGNATTTLYKIDMQANPPAQVGTITTPVNVRYCAFDPTADSGNGGFWIGDWASNIVLISTTGATLYNIPAAAHGLTNTSGIVWDGISSGGPYLWTIDGNSSVPVTIRQIKISSGQQTGNNYNLVTTDPSISGAVGGGMFILNGIVGSTNTLGVVIQNKKLIGFDLASAQTNQYDLGVISTTLDDRLPSTIDYAIQGKIKNFGTTNINNYKISYKVDDDPVQTYTVSGVNIVQGTEANFNHPTKVSPVIGQHQIKIWTSEPNGEEDQFTPNDTLQKSYEVYDSSDEVPRYILLEEFTSSTCAPCTGGNVNLANVLKQNDAVGGKYTLIKYQMNWPGVGDPYYTLEGGTKRAFYSVNAVPSLYVDNTYRSVLSGFTNQILLDAQALPAFCDIQAEYRVDGKMVTASAIIIPKIDYPTNIQFFMAIVEKTTYKNKMSNGETEFEQVMKKFMPNEQGISLGNLTANLPIVKDQTYTFNGEYRLPINGQNANIINHAIEHSVEDFGNLEVVVWAQNMTTKEVLQSATAQLSNMDQKSVYFTPLGENGTLSATLIGNTINSGIKVVKGSTVIFTAVPDEEFKVKNWKLNGEIVPDITENEYTLTINTHSVVTVEFISSAVTTYPLTYAVVNGNGTISATQNGNPIASGEEIVSGAEVVFTAVPNTDYKVLNWKLNGVVIDGNQTNSLEITVTGATSVTVEFVYDGVGIISYEDNNLLLYPNPHRNEFTLSNIENAKNVTITNLMGQVLKEITLQDNSYITIKTDELTNGIYFVTLNFKNGVTVVRKFVKNNY
ncbi:MAG: T9SS type A sorting domain-containing protein [Lentimicrobiaceae bacterium]|nr:T9SS type A sorting domain-containing protein [Lentimicrobiaceae bacterium]